jgi:hypothetical protein
MQLRYWVSPITEPLRIRSQLISAEVCDDVSARISILEAEQVPETDDNVVNVIFLQLIQPTS